MNADELARAARELIDSASDPFRCVASDQYSEVVLVPANLLWLLREALDQRYAPPTRQHEAAR